MSISKPQFDVGKIIGDSWGIFKGNVGPLLGAVVVMWVIVVVSGWVFIGPIILTGPLLLGLFKMAQSAVREQPVEFGDLFSGFQKFLPAFLAYLLITIFSAIGMIFCIIPGILISILYTPTYLIILNGNLGFWDAMEASRKMVMDNFGQWIILSLVLFVLNLVGALACGVGLLVTMPMSLIIITVAYDLECQAADSTAAISPAPPVLPSAPSA